MSEDLKNSALEYHRMPQPGKLQIKATKPMQKQSDLALAYSPGVAYPCEEIAENPLTAADYTARSNLVAVITNGTAVLGMGSIGALASKPVMEGKAVLFKQFADIDVFDIEIEERDPHKFIDIVAPMEPTFGGINLEDIKAPECFIIEKGLKERMNIPVFHDDQHGTAIVVAAAITNGLKVVEKDIAEVKLVASGAGAAALACLDLLVGLGMKRENITVTDIAGVVYEGRQEEMDPYKAKYAIQTNKRTLQEVMPGADVFLGLSVAGVLKPEFLTEMADRPLIMALANPTPEILPDQAMEVRRDAIIATGRSDYPNQVNNVLCFPFLFRGALDVGATEINEAMKHAAVNAIARLAMAEPSDIVRSAYGGQELQFGPQYLIPKPFDPRLMAYIAPAVARAAMESGVAQRPLKSLFSYRRQLTHTVFQTGMMMMPVFDQARDKARRVVFAEGEEEKVLLVLPQIIDHGIARAIIIGRRDVVERKLNKLALTVEIDEDFDLIDPTDIDSYLPYADDYYKKVARMGYSPIESRHVLRTDSTVLAAMMVCKGRADAMICGTRGRFQNHLRHIEEVIGKAEGINKLSAMNALVMSKGTIFIADTYVQEDPSAEELEEIVSMCAEEVRRFGVEPRVGLMSYSVFGTREGPSVKKMKRALELIKQSQPKLAVEGEMQADIALDIEALKRRFPDAQLKEAANLLVMPNIDAANIAFTLGKQLADGMTVGPILVGVAESAHIVTQNTSVRGLLNMTAIAAVQAN